MEKKGTMAEEEKQEEEEEEEEVKEPRGERR